MKFNLKRACAECPFRKENGYLERGRAREIAHALQHDGSFTCHKTLDYTSGKPGETQKSAFCAGALSVMENEGSTFANVLIRLAAMGMGYDPDALLDREECFESMEAFILGHGG